MALKVGDKAPDFTLKSRNLTGDVKDVSLGDYKGKNLVILFYSQSFTGTCATEMCSASEGLGDISSLNAEVIGISVDSIFTQEAWSKASNIKYPLLSDFNREVITKYGTKYDDGKFVHNMNGVSKRAAFVVDKDGIIRYAEVMDRVDGLPNQDKIKETLKSLN